MVLIVLDINGVLGDVRKPRDMVVRHRAPDVFLPNRQPFYLRKNAGWFMQQCYHFAHVALWTSRTRHNAWPIEDYFVNCGFLHSSTLCMHGEDCRSSVNFRPIKEAAILRQKYPQFAREHIVFVDDSPQKIELDGNSEIVEVHTFNALKEGVFDYELFDASSKIEHIVKKWTHQ